MMMSHQWHAEGLGGWVAERWVADMMMSHGGSLMMSWVAD